MRIWLIIWACCVTAVLQACSGGAEKVPATAYFDLRAYFEAEAARLQSAAPLIRKAVSIDSSAEVRQLKIESWADEFSAFSEADINKAAWRGMYSVQKQGDIERYTATSDKTPVRLLTIYRQGNQVKSLQITIKTENTLYTSTEELSYYPDSLYEINKVQAVRFKALKNYKVKGIFINAQTLSSAQNPTVPLP